MTSADLAVLSEQIDQYAAQFRRERTQRLGEESVTWLALPPQWTGRLAEHCRFPAPKPLSLWVSDAAAAGLCQRQVLFTDEDDDLDRTDWPDVRFWMPENERADVLGDIRGRTKLRRLAAVIGDGIRSAPAAIKSDPGLDRWADLAVRGPTDPRTGEWLTKTVSECVAAGRMADALDWVYAGEALGPVLGEEVASAATRAKRLINLEYRRRLDARFVEHFVRREGQREAVEQLLSRRKGEPWALHFVGMGGVGKTMLIRYLSGAFSEDGGPDIAVTRVDFDHISPRYPVEQPGQLLRELAGGLASRLLEADQVSAYGHFIECADVLDRVRAKTPGRGGVGSAEFENALDAFAALIKAIKVPVVLILDTCEELAKLHPAGEPVPSIERTFEILERLHKKVSGVRVILAGRRLLAAEYSNWRLPTSTSRPAWAVSLAKRDYLRLFEIRGFTEAEARHFLSRLRESKHEIPRDVEDAILRVAPDSGRVAGVAAGDAAPSADFGHLYNPYELDLYADWFDQTDGALTAAQIESGDFDAYVEARIIQRLPSDPPVARVLPAVAILGRVDVHMVHVILAQPEVIGDRVFRTLAEQEWIAARTAEESGVTVLEVQPSLLLRLTAYFGRSNRLHMRDAALTTLQGELPKLLRRRPLDAAAVEHVAAAMSVLSDEAALSLWSELTDRIARDGEWAWAVGACARLLATDGEAGTTLPALEAAIRTVYIGALRRRDPAYDAAEDWGFAGAAADRHPNKEERSALAERAVLGIAAANARHRGRLERFGEGVAFSRAWSRALAARDDTQRLAAALAVAEAYLDAGADRQTGTLPPIGDVRKLAWLSEERGDPRLTAFARLIVARTELRAGLGSPQFEQAESLAPEAAQDPSPLDWPLPRSAKARIRLQWLDAAIGAPEFAPSLDLLQTWLDEAADCDDIEHERLASAVLLRLLSSGPVDASQVRALDEVVRRLPPLLPLCQAHIETPPLAASVIRAWLALGEPDRARAVIEAWEESSPSAEHDAATTAHIHIATVYLARRMRWRGWRDTLVLTLATGGSPEQMLYARATQMLLGNTAETQMVLGKAADGEIGEQSLRIADIEWRTALALNSRDAASALQDVAPHLDSAAADPVLAAHLALDRQEARSLGQRMGQSPSYQTEGDSSEAESAIELRQETGAGSPALATQLRAIRLRRWAMSADEWSMEDEAPHDWAEAALEEGELLALRLPREGKRLLDLAVRLFDQTGDMTAAAMAAIRAIIADYHAGNTTAITGARADFRMRYDRLRAMPGSTLPVWEEIADPGRIRLEDAGADHAWDGWLLRLAACIEPSRGQRQEPGEQAAELNMNRAAKRWALPARYYRLADKHRETGETAAGGAGFIVFGAAVGRAALSGLGWYPPPIVGWTVGAVAVFVALIVVIIAAVVIGSPLMNLIGAQVRLAAFIDPIVPAAGSLDRASVALQVQVRGLDLGRLVRTVFGALVNRFARPRPATAELPLHPDPLRTVLPERLVRVRQWARALNANALVLRVGPKAIPGAWEAVLSLDQVTSTDTGQDRHFRSIRAYTARKPRPVADSAPHVAVLCARPFALFAEESWEAGHITPLLLYGEEFRAFEREPGADVLHLIGTPVMGELGPELAIEGSAAHAVHPDRLPLLDFHLIVVQAEPTRSSISADPRSDLMRAIAHQLAEASGGATVIAIPALPNHLAVTLMQEIARTLTREPQSRKNLLSLGQRLRMIVFEAGDPKSAVAARALPAFDLCLYLGE